MTLIKIGVGFLLLTAWAAALMAPLRTADVWPPVIIAGAMGALAFAVFAL